MDETMKYFLDVIQTEWQKHKDGNYTGHVEYKVNFQGGDIININNTLRRTIWKPQKRK